MTPPHLDEEALSAAVDGEATGAEQAHLATCPDCGRRAEALRAVARAVASPVPPRLPAATDAAIRSAIDSAAAPARPWRRALALAAAVVVVLGGAGLLTAVLRGGSAGRRTAASVSATPAQQGASAGAGAQAGAAAGAGARAGAAASGSAAPNAGYALRVHDLGAQSDPAVVARLIDGQLNAPDVPISGNGAAGAGAAATAIAPVCVDQGAAALFPAGQHPSLRYLAALSWRGQDAVALVFDGPTGGRSGVVMARAGCRLLAHLPV